MLGDELYNYLLRTGALPVETVQKIFTQLVGAVAYIHGQSCVHRDLKLENVLLDTHENVKLCDFGFTREYEGTANYLQTFCGTICYSAPEMLRGEKYAGEKVDVWSLGIILYALLKGELPFDEDDDEATKNKILKDDPAYPDTFPLGAKVLLSKMLSKRPLLRPTLAEILTDPFLADYAPQQQAILKVTQPAPFTTELEKKTLERMRSAGVDIDQVIENVLAQRCDTLAGWWALLIEKEQRKEIRRERKRKEKEAELKTLRRLSGASGRLDKIGPPLVEVDEGSHRPGSAERPHSNSRGSSRGRAVRRSTPQILVSDLPQLPEGAAVGSPDEAKSPLPPQPIDKDSIRSKSSSRPPIPPKERKRRSSQLQIVTTNREILSPVNGINKGRLKNHTSHQFLRQLTAIKHWLVDSAKRTRSPAKSPPQNSKGLNGNESLTAKGVGFVNTSALTHGNHVRDTSGASGGTRSSFGAGLTPSMSNPEADGARNHQQRAAGVNLDTARVHQHRNSLSPSPITPRSSYRRGSGGLRGRKSTSSSLSSIRSMPRHPTHSKASSASSNSVDTLHSPGSRSVGRSPHSSIKVLPATPTSPAIPSNSRFVRNGDPEAVKAFANPENDSSPVPFLGIQTTGLMFARRKKSAFKGPMLNSSFFGSIVGPGHASPMIRNREGSDTRLNFGLRDLTRRSSGAKRSTRRKSQIIEEEEEEDVEEVETFSPVDLARGESVHSITVWDELCPKPDAQKTGASTVSQGATAET